MVIAWVSYFLATLALSMAATMGIIMMIGARGFNRIDRLSRFCWAPALTFFSLATLAVLLYAPNVATPL
jgi:hypothetical protein